MQLLHTQFSGELDATQLSAAQEFAGDLLFRMNDDLFLDWVIKHTVDYESSVAKIQIPYSRPESGVIRDYYVFNYDDVYHIIFSEGKRRLTAPRITQTMVVVDMRGEPFPYCLATGMKRFIDEFVKVSSTQTKEPLAINKDGTLNRYWVDWYCSAHSVDTRAGFIAGAVLIAGVRGIDLNKFNYHFSGNSVLFHIKPEFQEFSS